MVYKGALLLQKIQTLILTALFTALTIVFSYLSFHLPFTQVPFTLQVLGVFLSGLLLGPRYGSISMLLYLLIGALGFPVFAGGIGGIGILLGPYGGYLLTYPIAAYLIGRTSQRSPLLAILIGLMTIYLGGFLGLMFVLHLSPSSAFLAGVLPFLPWDFAKGIITILLLNRFKKMKSLTIPLIH